MHLNLIAASDAEALSMSRKEWEVLLAPGTELEITSLKPFSRGSEQWWALEATQIGVAECQRR